MKEKEWISKLEGMTDICNLKIRKVGSCQYAPSSMSTVQTSNMGTTPNQQHLNTAVGPEVQPQVCNGHQKAAEAVTRNLLTWLASYHSAVCRLNC